MGIAEEDHAVDPDVRLILDALDTLKVSNPRAEVASYRQNSGSIRIRVINPDFSGVDKATRHDRIWEILETLSEDIQSQITVLLLLTPDEVGTSFANMDFEHPIPSRL